MKNLLLSFLLSVIATMPHPDTPPPLRVVPPANPSEKELLARVKLILPQGWVARYTTFDGNTHFLDIEHVEADWLVSTAPNQSIIREESQQPYLLSLRILPLVTKQVYRQLVDENKETSLKMSRLYDQISLSPKVRGKTDSFSEDPGEKKNIAEYDRLKASLHDLPDYYFQDITLNWVWHDLLVPTDEETWAKYQGVEKQFTAVLSAY